MPNPVLLDYHIHTTYSFDSRLTMHAACLAAIVQGIPEIGLSEHFDLNPASPDAGFYRPDAWWQEVEKVRAEFAGRLTVRAGIEIGEAHRFPAEVEALLGRYPYDYAIGSLHYVGEEYMFDQAYLNSHTAEEILEGYFTELESMTRAPRFDILGHLDLPVRNARHIWEGYDPSRYESLIRKVLQNCIRAGLALDVNLAGLRKPSHNIMPDPRILRWYAEMGGRRVTLGSDAHAREQVGRYLQQGLGAVRAAGLSSLTQFELRQARLLPLE
jgi:histidinol-phosphatase (PHP family)